MYYLTYIKIGSQMIFDQIIRDLVESKFKNARKLFASWINHFTIDGKIQDLHGLRSGQKSLRFMYVKYNAILRLKFLTRNRRA